MSRFVGLLGISLIIGVGVLLSSNRRAIRWQVIAWGLGLQLFFAVFVLQVPAGQELFRALGAAVTALLHFSYRRFLENRLRDEFGFAGTGIKLIFRGRHEE